MRKLIFLFISITMVQGAAAQTPQDKPKLVVGIVVDQMRQEYLYRFNSKFGEGGFKRMMGEGFMMQNAHYNYMPTYTGPGHASVYTGTTPAIHGIIGNDWYERNLKEDVNCVGDSQFKPVGVETGNGAVAPSRLLSSTVTDELKLATQKRAKVVGVSLKDRGAVLPAGHMPDGAYWFDGKSGKFITSTYYKQALPLWLEQFNNQKLTEKYLSQDWNTLLPIAQYTESGLDDSPYEVKIGGNATPTFPYKLKELRKKDSYELITSTPFGNDLLADLAKAAIDGEEMGKDEITDFLTVSFSSTDIIGHSVGPNAVEVEDTYLRLDKNIEALLNKLDKDVGKGQYVLFLTADHAVADVPQYMKDQRMPAGIFNENVMEARLNAYLEPIYPGKKLIETISNGQIFLNHEVFVGDPKTAGVDMMIAIELISKFLLAQDGIANVYAENVLRQGNYGEVGMRGMVIRGYHVKRSGDIVYKFEPGWISWRGLQGTTHGSNYAYDTHVPMLLFGRGIRKGASAQYHPITDLAPTISVLLRIKFPSGCSGQPIVEALEN